MQTIGTDVIDMQPTGLPSRRRLLLVAGTACAILVVVGLRPISDVDLLWQLKLGQLIVQQRALVQTDPFTFTHHGQYFPPLCWLAQVVYAFLYSIGSWQFLQIFDNLMFVGAFVIAGLSVKPWETRSVAIAAAMGVGFLMGAPHNSVRPQTFALLGMAALLALRGSTLPDVGKMIGGALILVLWQNLHPSVVIPGLVLGALLLADVWDWWHGDRTAPIRVDVVLLIAVALAQFATPMGFSLVAVSQRNKDLSLHLPQPAVEWLPCWDPRIRSQVLGSMVAPGLLTLVLLLGARFRVRAADLALLLVMTALSAAAWRFAFFAAVVLIPVWSRLFDRALPPVLLAEPKPTPGPSIASLGAAALLFALVAAIVPVLARPTLFSPENFPDAGIRALRGELRDGRVYNFNPYGGPLIFHGKGAWQLLIDGRIYLFSDAEWKEYFDAAAGDVSVDTLVEKHAPDAFFLHPYVQHGLITLLRKHPQWQEVWSDATCSVFVRRQPDTAIAQREGTP